MFEDNSCTITPSSKNDLLEKKKKLNAFYKYTDELAILTPISNSEQVNRLPSQDQSNVSLDIDFNVTIEKIEEPVENDTHDPPKLPETQNKIVDNEKVSKSEESSRDDHDEHNINLDDYEKIVSNSNLFNSQDLRTVSRSKQKSSLPSFMELMPKKLDRWYHYGPRKRKDQNSVDSNHKLQFTSNVNESPIASNVSETSNSRHESSDTSVVRNDSTSIVSVSKTDKSDSLNVAEIDGTQNNFPTMGGALKSSTKVHGGLQKSTRPARTTNNTEKAPNISDKHHLKIVEPANATFVQKTFRSDASKLVLNAMNSVPDQIDSPRFRKILPRNIQNEKVSITPVHIAPKASNNNPHHVNEVSLARNIQNEEVSISPVRVIPKPCNNNPQHVNEDSIRNIRLKKKSTDKPCNNNPQHVNEDSLRNIRLKKISTDKPCNNNPQHVNEDSIRNIRLKKKSTDKPCNNNPQHVNEDSLRNIRLKKKSTDAPESSFRSLCATVPNPDSSNLSRLENRSNSSSPTVKVLPSTFVNTVNDQNMSSVHFVGNPNVNNILPSNLMSVAIVNTIVPSNTFNTVSNIVNTANVVSVSQANLVSSNNVTNILPSNRNTVLNFHNESPANLGNVINISPSNGANMNNLAAYSMANISIVTSPGVSNLNMSLTGSGLNSSPRSNVSIITPPRIGNNTSPDTTDCSLSSSKLVHIVPKPSDSHSPVSCEFSRIAPKPGNSDSLPIIDKDIPKSNKKRLTNLAKAETRTRGKSIQIAPKSLNSPTTSPLVPVSSFLKSFPSDIKAQLNLVMSDRVNLGDCVQDLRDTQVD
ncbi:hypothetical protein WDU94_006433 [Cyamophila willieti]